MSAESGIWGNFNFIKFPNNVSYYKNEIRFFSLSKNQGLCMQQPVDFPDANLSQWRAFLSFTGTSKGHLRVSWLLNWLWSVFLMPWDIYPVCIPVSTGLYCVWQMSSVMIIPLSSVLCPIDPAFLVEKSPYTKVEIPLKKIAPVHSSKTRESAANVETPWMRFSGLWPIMPVHMQ